MNTTPLDNKPSGSGSSKKWTRASIAAAVAAGALTTEAANLLYDQLEPEPEPIPEPAPAPTPEPEPAEGAVAEVNPDDVMLEEPVAEPIAEPVADTDIIAEAQPQPGVGGDYQPFASNDPIENDVFLEPQPEEVLIAENTDTDVVVGEDSAVDLICGVSEDESVMTEETVCPEDDLYADNSTAPDDYDVQSDLMA